MMGHNDVCFMEKKYLKIVPVTPTYLYTNIQRRRMHYSMKYIFQVLKPSIIYIKLPADKMNILVFSKSLHLVINIFLTLLHSERPKLYATLAFLSAIGLIH